MTNIWKVKYNQAGAYNEEEGAVGVIARKKPISKTVLVAGNSLQEALVEAARHCPQEVMYLRGFATIGYVGPYAEMRDEQSR